MNGYLRQSTASQTRTIGVFVDDTDFKTLEDGLTVANTDIKIKKNGGASASKNSGGLTADGAGGFYAVTWDATDTATVGELFYSIKVAGALVAWGSYTVLEEAVYDAFFAASAPGYVVDQPVNATKLAGTSLTARDIGASVLLSSGTGTGQVKLSGGYVAPNWGDVGNPTTTVGLSGTTVKTATDVETDTADIQSRLPAALVIGRMDSSVGAMAANVLTATAINADAITAAKVAADVTTELQSGLATSSAVSTLQTSVDDLPTNSELATALGTADDAVLAQVALVKAKTDLIPSDPADASDVAGAFSTVNTKLDTIDGKADDILADTDELQTDWADGGRLDNLLDGASSAGDPWTTALPGSYGAGTAGKIVGDNLNATVGSRATQTSVDDLPTNAELATALAAADDATLAAVAAVASTLSTIASYIDTEVAAIKAKTDNLPADPADASDVAGGIAGLASTLTTIASYLDTEIAAIKAKTDALPSSPAAVGSAMTLTSAYDYAKGTAAMPESYAANGAEATPIQLQYMIWSYLANKALAGLLVTAKELDGTTPAMTFDVDDGSAPTSQVRAS